jgi:hypothetical protein
LALGAARRRRVSACLRAARPYADGTAEERLGDAIREAEGELYRELIDEVQTPLSA